MALASQDKSIKKERQQIYFDIVCGLTCSITALTLIIILTLGQDITNFGMYLVGIAFWIFYFCFSIFLLCLGIYSWYQDKHWDESKQKKNLKPPRIG